jgi:hypothetical protein
VFIGRNVDVWILAGDIIAILIIADYYNTLAPENQKLSML